MFRVWVGLVRDVARILSGRLRGYPHNPND
jgi:hypothetical protein